MATTADGKIATANRAVTSFGSVRDLEHLYELRATADAVMCGARTVEISGSILGTGGAKFQRQRLKHGLAEHNLRVIVSGSGSIDSHAPIFTQGTAPLIILTTERISPDKLKQLSRLATEVAIFGKVDLNLPAALRWLRKKWRIKRLLCEGGGELNDAMFRADLVDEIHLTICPKIFGGSTAPTIADGLGLPELALTKRFHFQSIKAINAELFTVLLKGNLD
jgi:5-amino-6-(5-phosphoribosylamino)uracil reductase